MTQLVADPVETRVFFFLADKAFDLTNAGKIVVQQRIHRRRSLALQSVAAVCGQCIPKRAADQKGQRR